MTKQEIAFCEYLAETMNPEKAALLSGIQNAAKLLEKPSVRKRCKKLIKNRFEIFSAISGLMKIAFSNPAETVNAFLSDNPPNLSDGDLFCVSEIKKGSNGTVEVKFFDKLRALQLLSEISPKENENKMKGFYEAILAGAKSINEDRNDEE